MPDRERFALVKTTLVDYPGKVACAVFLPGCHLRCPYCHNPSLVDLSRPDAASVLEYDFDSYQEFLNRRARFLGGIVFSGGEALLHSALPSLVKEAREHKLAVKIDSAGLLPGRLKRFLDAGELDYVAVDLKTVPARYNELGWPSSPPDQKQSAEQLLKETFSLLEESGIEYEIRSTIVPGLVDIPELRIMAELAGRAEKWVWQPYRKGETLNPDWNNLNGWTEEELQSIADNFPEADNVVVR